MYNGLKFPKRLKGVYLSLLDSSTLSINDKLIQRIYDFDYKIHPNQLDSTTQHLGDTLIDIKTKKRELIKKDGDSLLIHVYKVDTLFLIGVDNVLRKFRGYYFLNTRYDNASWLVEKVQLSKGQLVISEISKKEDIENLSKITGNDLDTISNYNFTITKKKFKKFVSDNGFKDKETFLRIRK